MAWPKTSDKEFSKRICRTFMWAYFAQILLTLVLIFFADADTALLAIEVFTASSPAYMLVFGAVIAKSGVENIAKGKTTIKTVTTKTTVDESDDGESNG